MDIDEFLEVVDAWLKDKGFEETDIGERAVRAREGTTIIGAIGVTQAFLEDAAGPGIIQKALQWGQAAEQLRTRPADRNKKLEVRRGEDGRGTVVEVEATRS